MFFFSTKSAGWVVLICSAIILGIAIYGAIANGLPTPEAQSAFFKLVAGGVGGMLLGAGMNYLFNRKK